MKNYLDFSTLLKKNPTARAKQPLLVYIDAEMYDELMQMPFGGAEFVNEALTEHLNRHNTISLLM